MEKMTVTMRITLWYSLLMLVIAVLVLGFMLAMSESTIQSNARDRLITVIEHNAEEIECDDGAWEIDNDDFDFLKSGVSSLVYTDDLTLLQGRLPEGFEEEADFAHEQVSGRSFAGGEFLTYDRKLTHRNAPDIWIRGILPMDAVSGVTGSLMRIALITLPFLVLLAVVGGYLITHRAFLPVRRINQAVESITEGKDLTRRVDAAEGGDEMHTLAENVNHMLERLEIAFETEKQFVSDVSHELRTPVSVILAQCEYALEQEQHGQESVEALQVVQRQAERMHRLISQLLNLVRMEQGNVPVTLQRTDISALLETLVEEAEALAPEPITLEHSILGGIYANMDTTLLTRLFQNLVQNAMKHGRSSVTISLDVQDGKAALRVSDDGEGIPASEQPKIWRRFYQVNPSRTAEGDSGMGLGLAIVQLIAKLLRGEMQLESDVGKGSVFTFLLPKA